MVKVVGVRFKNAGKIYYFDPGDLELYDGDKVVVETVRGLEFGEIVGGADMVPEDKISPPLKKVIRKATPEDETRVAANREREQKAFESALAKIEAHGLPMKLVDVEYTFDNSKIIFFFTSEGRVDFRELVKDLAGVFKTRIELRQIGVRDEAKMVGGLGTCGRPLCCVTFLEDFEPVSIRMAKDQNLSLNPSKISGMCGRLMCCLRYEHEAYQELRKGMPPVGSEFKTNAGVGKIIELNVLSGTATVRMDDGTIVNVNVRQQENDPKACPAGHGDGGGDDSDVTCQGNQVSCGNKRNSGEEKEDKPKEDALTSEEVPQKKGSAKPRRRSQRNRRKRRPSRAESGEAKKDEFAENPVGKQVGSRGKGINDKTKTDDKGKMTAGKQMSGQKDKADPGTKPRRRRRRRNSRTSSKPRQKPENVSEPKENPTGTGGR
jgi:cell fate regulator YaaT (PSP1 superfamily)